MSLKVIVLTVATLALLSYVSLSFLNPSLADYQQSILTRVADQEAEIFATADRRAIEQEASILTSQFAAVRYDLRRLDAEVIRRNHPLLGAALSHQNESSGVTLTERLLILKEKAIKRIKATRETMRYGILVELTAHTKRHSYGIWSNFSTCLNNKTFSYSGVAGRFYERTAHDCATTDRLK